MMPSDAANIFRLCSGECILSEASHNIYIGGIRIFFSVCKNIPASETHPHKHKIILNQHFPAYLI